MRSYGARVVVTEIDPICALQLNGRLRGENNGGYPRRGNIFVTATGNCDVITLDHMLAMKDQAIVCNIGHPDNEIQVEKLNNAAG